MVRILVSSCLSGERVRYDGATDGCKDSILVRWRQQGHMLVFCPEVAGGLSVPRPPAEIIGKGGGSAVIEGRAKVINRHGRDVTEHFFDGAQKALEKALFWGVKVAVMKDGSPSCGSSYIYDGSFTGGRTAGQGVTAALLGQMGIRVFSERQIAQAAAHLTRLQAIKFESG